MDIDQKRNLQTNQMNKENKLVKFLKENYLYIIPILVTIALYSVSLTYGFRNFDEDVQIKDFYVKKTFPEYFERFLFLNQFGVTEAQGYAFSSIKNVHFSIIASTVNYFISYLFQAKPLLYHIWNLILHCLAVFSLILLINSLSGNKLISLFTGLIWAIHPTNVESVIWATNWPPNMGAAIYFFTLYFVSKVTNIKNTLNTKLFIFLLTIFQVFLTEYNIMIPISIFILNYYLLKSFKSSLVKSIPAFLAIVIYFIVRFTVTKNVSDEKSFFDIFEIIQRIIYLSPQVFIHQLKLILIPINLSIDQLDLLHLDTKVFGTYNLFCIVIMLLLIYVSFLFRKRFSFFSLGCILYIISLLPFLQIIPLYSVVAERYNYYGSAFIIFGLISLIYGGIKLKKNLLVSMLVLLSLISFGRSIFRIQDWRNSSTLFYSTVNTSKSLIKKGIWTYNLAICQEDEKKKEEFLRLSINLLKLYLENNEKKNYPKTVLKYELDNESLLGKASLRIAQIYEILNEENNQLLYLEKTLSYSKNKPRLKGLAYKGLGTYYFQNKNYEKAIDYYKESNLVSSQPDTDYAIAVCYLKLNDLANYETYIKKSTSITSTGNGNAFKTYGQFLETYRNDYEGAIKNYRTASLLMNKPKPYILLATLCLKSGKIAKASGIIKRGLYSFPDNPSLLYLRGSTLISKGKLKEGMNDLSKAAEIRKSPKDIRTASCLILANIYLNQNDFSNAKKYNDMVLMIDPDNKEALRLNTAIPRNSSS